LSIVCEHKKSFPFWHQKKGKTVAVSLRDENQVKQPYTISMTAAHSKSISVGK